MRETRFCSKSSMNKNVKLTLSRIIYLLWVPPSRCQRFKRTRSVIRPWPRFFYRFSRLVQISLIIKYCFSFPVYEYDFPAPYIKPQEWFPLREPFNLYMDKYRDPKQINKEYLLRKLKNEDPFKTPPPPFKFPNAQYLPTNMPSWLKLHEKKIRLRWGRVNDV